MANVLVGIHPSAEQVEGLGAKWEGDLGGWGAGGEASVRVRVCGQCCVQWEVNPLGFSEKPTVSSTHRVGARPLIPHPWPPLLEGCSQGGETLCPSGLLLHQGQAGIYLGGGPQQTDTGSVPFRWEAGGAQPVWAYPEVCSTLYI